MVTAREMLAEPEGQWLAAAPLWAPLRQNGDRAAAGRPMLLRFASDEFMDDFAAVLENAPERLGEWAAVRETWRKPAPIPLPVAAGAVEAAATLGGATEDGELLTTQALLKLYMPAHQRFYLVTASLVCRIPGLPDKWLDTTREERATFALRRSIDGVEHAYADGAWQPVDAGRERTLIPGEKQYPLIRMSYRETPERRRQVWVGLAPVSQREALMTAAVGKQPAASASAQGASRIDQLLTVADMDVFAPWRAINDAQALAVAVVDEGWDAASDAERGKLRATTEKTRDRLQSQSWYTLLDFARYLEEWLPAVWAAIQAAPTTPPASGAPGKALIDALQAATYQRETAAGKEEDVLIRLLTGRRCVSADTVTMAEALAAVHAENARKFLEAASEDYVDGRAGWPAKRFLLCGVDALGLVDRLDDGPGGPGLLRTALTELPPPDSNRIPLIPDAAAVSRSVDAQNYANNSFTIRCVFERPCCPPTARPTVVSEATEPFEMAAYFDPDAPMRAVRIALPVDTTPAGLRKHARNAMFVMSDALACQVKRARSMSFGDLVLSVLPWPFHKDLPDAAAKECKTSSVDIGMLCTLSIPIITLCALILLIIIVALLDVIFKWIPYLIFCLPLPGLKAKRSNAP